MLQPQKKRKLNNTTPEKGKPAAVEEMTTTPPPDVADKTFEDLGIIPQLVEACKALGFTKPRPIQVESIPLALEGRDVIGLAETGSGKTAAFGLPMLQGKCRSSKSS
jgi:ATP-dependent RNA helicase DDX47/RRP3